MLTKTFYNDTKTQSATFYIPEHFKKIAVHVSSGKDSSLCLYLLCQMLRENKRTDIIIVAAHVVDLVRVPYSKKDFDNIIDEFQKYFSDIKFERDYVTYVERPGYPKIIETRKQMVSMIKNKQVEAVFGGRTRPPPKELLEMIRVEGGYKEVPDAIQQRLEENVTALNIVKALDKNLKVTDDVENCKYLFSNPLLTTDSYFSVEYYRKENFLKNTIFPLTRSCVGGIFETKNWTQPCKACWWCREKKMIFGAYDAEELK